MNITQIGHTSGSTKLHIAMTHNGMTCCDHTLRINTTVADLPDGGLTATIKTLTGLNIRPSRLCFHCFPIRTRKALANAYRAA